MGILKSLFGDKKPSINKTSVHSFSDSDIKVISASAMRIVEVINESLDIASKTANPETKKSRLDVARTKLDEVKAMVIQYPFLKLTSLEEVERDIASLSDNL